RVAAAEPDHQQSDEGEDREDEERQLALVFRQLSDHRFPVLTTQTPAVLPWLDPEQATARSDDLRSHCLLQLRHAGSTRCAWIASTSAARMISSNRCITVRQNRSRLHSLRARQRPTYGHHP